MASPRSPGTVAALAQRRRLPRRTDHASTCPRDGRGSGLWLWCRAELQERRSSLGTTPYPANSGPVNVTVPRPTADVPASASIGYGSYRATRSRGARASRSRLQNARSSISRAKACRQSSSRPSRRRRDRTSRPAPSCTPYGPSSPTARHPCAASPPRPRHPPGPHPLEGRAAVPRPDQTGRSARARGQLHDRALRADRTGADSASALDALGLCRSALVGVRGCRSQRSRCHDHAGAATRWAVRQRLSVGRVRAAARPSRALGPAAEAAEAMVLRFRRRLLGLGLGMQSPPDEVEHQADRDLQDHGQKENR
jgi:hypothetical protein